MAWYNLTAIDAHNIVTLTQTINTEFMQNDLGNLILLMIFFITHISFSLFIDDPKVNLTAAASIVAILSIPMRLLSLTPDFTPFLCWGFFALNIVILMLSK